MLCRKTMILRIQRLFPGLPRLQGHYLKFQVFSRFSRFSRVHANLRKPENPALILSLRESTTLSGFRHKFRIVQHVTKHVIKRYFRFHINKCSIRASFCASDFLLVFPPTLMADTVFAGYSTTSFRFIFVAPTAITALVCLVSQGWMFLLQCVLAP